MGFVKLLKLGQELNSWPSDNFSAVAISRWIQMDMNCPYSSTSSGSPKPYGQDSVLSLLKKNLFQSGFNWYIIYRSPSGNNGDENIPFELNF